MEIESGELASFHLEQEDVFVEFGGGDRPVGHGLAGAHVDVWQPGVVGVWELVPAADSVGDMLWNGAKKCSEMTKDVLFLSDHQKGGSRFKRNRYEDLLTPVAQDVETAWEEGALVFRVRGSPEEGVVLHPNENPHVGDGLAGFRSGSSGGPRRLSLERKRTRLERPM